MSFVIDRAHCLSKISIDLIETFSKICACLRCAIMLPYARTDDYNVDYMVFRTYRMDSFQDDPFH